MQKHTAELTADFKTTCTQYESKISQTRDELEEAKRQWMAATEDLKDSHQTSLTESQQEMENLQREIQRLNRQYEDDVRYLEEQLELNAADFERERERLLLLQDELSEQLALKEGFLQDVQEEEEDANRAGPPKPSPSANTSDDSSHGDSVLNLALEDLQSQNMMLQEELVFLRNVKRELESELKQVREEFTVEKEELEFRIDELQMNRGEERRSVSEESHSDGLKQTCWSAGGEQRDTPSALSGDQERAERFMQRYRAMKEHTAASLQGLQEKLQSVFQERDRLLERSRNTEEASDPDEEGLQMSFEDLRNKTEEIIVNLQHKETLVLEMLKYTRSDPEHELKVSNLENQLSSMTEEKDERIKTLEEDASALQARQDECQDTIRLLQSQITGLSEERDTLQRDTEANQEHLSGLQRHIAEILQQSFSETEVDGSSGISALVDRLWTAAQEERAVMIQQLEEREERVTAELQARITDLLREKDLLKASLGDVVLDTEGLQKDLSQVQAMNEKLRAENHSLLAQVADFSRESPDETDAQVQEASELQQALADRDALISQLREEVAHLQVSSVCDASMKSVTEISEEKEKNSRVSFYRRA